MLRYLLPLALALSGCAAPAPDVTRAAAPAVPPAVASMVPLVTPFAVVTLTAPVDTIAIGRHSVGNAFCLSEAVDIAHQDDKFIATQARHGQSGIGANK